MTDYVTQKSAKSDTKKMQLSHGEYLKLDRDIRLALAHSLGNRLVKGIIMKQAKRPLDSIMLQLQMINGRLYRVTRSG